jgi:hypothetical protein
MSRITVGSLAAVLLAGLTAFTGKAQACISVPGDLPSSAARSTPPAPPGPTRQN